MSIMLRISLLLGALFALGIVINSVRKSRIRISDSVFWVISATLLLLFAIIPQIPFSFLDFLDLSQPATSFWLL